MFRPPRLALTSAPLDQLKTDALIVGLFEQEQAGLELINLTDGALSRLLSSGAFKAKHCELYHFYLNKGIRLLIVVGLGERAKFDAERARQASAKAVCAALELGATTVAMTLVEGLSDVYSATHAMLEGSLLALYKFHDYKSKLDDALLRRIDRLTLVVPSSSEASAAAALEHAKIVVDAVFLCRDLQNAPPNVANPTNLASVAREIASAHGLRCTVLEKPDLEKLGAGGILAVNSGAAEPARLVVLEYDGIKAKSATQQKGICLIGKGLTFDTGGISIKPSADMGEMKFDMSGAAVVLATMKAVARLKLPLRLIGLLPLTENLPGGRAYRPGDIIKLLGGRYVEIVNTDAEGRLVVADSLAYAGQFKPQIIIDLATLTSACMIALGKHAAGLFCNDEKLEKALIEAGNACHERVWPLPLFEEYIEDIKSDVADIKNQGHAKGYGGAITGALFLKEFVPKGCAWAHLDIAGVAWNSTASGYKPVGGSGFGVRLLLEFLEKVGHKI